MTECPSCGSQEIIEDVRLVDAVTSGREVAATVFREPGALLFRGAVGRPLQARVCAACGRAELYVSDPRGLLEAGRDLRAEEVTKAPAAGEPDAGEDACLRCGAPMPGASVCPSCSWSYETPATD